jgi:hypothetical protein
MEIGAKYQFSLHIYNYTRNKVVEVLRISTPLLRILEKNMAPLECLYEIKIADVEMKRFITKGFISNNKLAYSPFKLTKKRN